MPKITINKICINKYTSFVCDIIYMTVSKSNINKCWRIFVFLTIISIKYNIIQTTIMKYHIVKTTISKCDIIHLVLIVRFINLCKVLFNYT